MRPIQLAPALLVALGALAAPARAQETLVDEGNLVITRNGSPVGREAYRIVRAAAGGGQAFRATATISFDSARIALRLTTDSLGQPISYEAEVRVRTQLMAHVDGSGRPGRFSTLTKVPQGESAHDYVMGAAPLVIDEQAFDPYWFATLPPMRSAFSTIDPRRGTQGAFRFEERGQEPLRVGRGTVTARHYALIAPNGASRDVWVDAAGHLLRVDVAAQGLVAQRDELPH